MSEEIEGDNVTLETKDDVVVQEVETVVNDDKNTVHYDTYKRVLSKLKSRENEFDTLKEKYQTVQNDKLEAEGNKDQLIESLRKEVIETKGKLKATVGTIARSNAMTAIVDEAVKAGCNSPDVVKKFLEDQLGELEYDEDFQPDRDQVKALIEDARAKAPVLFGKEAPKIANHNNSSGGNSHSVKKLKDLKDEDLMKIWANSDN